MALTAKQKLEQQAAKEQQAIANFEAKADEYARSKGVALPDNFWDLAVSGGMGVSAKQLFAYYAPNKSLQPWYVGAYDQAKRNPLITDPRKLVDKFLADPKSTYTKAITKTISASNQSANQYIQDAQRFDVPIPEINSAITSGNNNLVAAAKGNAAALQARADKANGPSSGGLLGDVGRGVEKGLDKLGGGLEKVFPIAVQMALSYALPGAGSAIASQFGVSVATGTAIASTAFQMAQGKSFEDAVKSSMINLVTQMGAGYAATEFNKVINNPAITNAVVSAGASAAKSAMLGGSPDDIKNSFTSSIVGSAVTGTTGNRVAGAAASGAVTGGLTGALISGAGALGSIPKSTEPTKTPTKIPTTATPPFIPETRADASPLDSAESTSADPGIKVAGGDDSSALRMAGVSAMPEMLGKSDETASPLYAVTEEDETFYERTITGIGPDGEPYSYTATYDPSSGKVSYTTNGVTQDEEGYVVPSGGGGAFASSTRPNFSLNAKTTFNLPSDVDLDETKSDLSDYDFPPVDYSIFSNITPKIGVDPNTGTGLTAPSWTNVETDVGYTPIDYGLLNSSKTSGGLGLQMPTSPGIKSMGGGQGLTANVTNPVTGATGVVGGLGLTPTGAAPVLGNPKSFINNPAVTGQPVMATDPDYTKEPAYTPKIDIKPIVTPQAPTSPVKNPTGNPTGSIPISPTSFDAGLSPLESYLKTSGEKEAFELDKIKQLFPTLTPDMSKILMERVGVTPSMLTNPNLAPQGTSEKINSDEDLDLSAAEFADFGQPEEDTQYAAKGGSMKLPKGHKPEFITGQTGHYAQGRGTGQSDDIPAVLHDGDYVMDADTVAAFGDGSSKAGAGALEQFRRSIPVRHSSGGQPIPAKIADGEYVLPEAFVTSLGRGSNKQGAKMLDGMREQIRSHKRSAPDTKIPPKAKSPLQYMHEALKG